MNGKLLTNLMVLAALGGAAAGCNVYEESQVAKANETASAAAVAAKAAPAATAIAEVAPEVAGAEPAPSRISDPFRRADASFSRFPLNRSGVVPQSIGRLIDGESCNNEMIECTWEDANGVQHTFGGKVLAIKSIKLERGDTRSLSALGIGTARNPPEVLARIKAFLPEVKVECVRGPFAGENGRTACQGTFRNGGWFKLLFSSQDGWMEEVRIDAFQIN